MRSFAAAPGAADDFKADAPTDRALSVVDEAGVIGMRSQKKHAILSTRLRTRIRDGETAPGRLRRATRPWRVRCLCAGPDASPARTTSARRVVKRSSPRPGSCVAGGGLRSRRARACHAHDLRPARPPAATPYYQRYRIGPAKKVDRAHFRERAALSGVVEHATKRDVTIYKMGPVTNVTEPRMSGRHWAIKFNHVDTWGSTVMGWASSTDVMRGVGNKLIFNRLEDAIAFCIRTGWTDYRVKLPPRAWTDQSYNLIDHKTLPRYVEVYMDEQGPRKARKRWEHAGAGKSNWQNRLRSSYGNEKWTSEY